ncbi:MAG: hypothetical protein AAF788_05930 [Pseudomonadota bacterium]
MAFWSVLGLTLIAPLGAMEAATPPSSAETAPLDALISLVPMDDDAMRQASGRGAEYGIDLSAADVVSIGSSQNNSSTIDGSIANTTLNDTVTGAQNDNAVNGNSGITTVFINSGNNVVLQNSVQVNVYTPNGL